MVKKAIIMLELKPNQREREKERERVCECVRVCVTMEISSKRKNDKPLKCMGPSASLFSTLL